MTKEELRHLICSVDDDKVKNALWELYELKYCNKVDTWGHTNIRSGFNDIIYTDKSITTAHL